MPQDRISCFVVPSVASWTGQTGRIPVAYQRQHGLYARKKIPSIAARRSNTGLSILMQLPKDKLGETKTDRDREIKESSDEPDSMGVPMTSWLIVGLLLMTNIHQQWTRALVFYLVSFKVPASDESARLYMNIDLGFGEEQYGLLASFGFTLLFTVFSLVAGRAADSGNRAGITALAAAGWSVATAAQGIAGSFDNVLGARALTGLSQAFTNPAAYGLIASIIPEARVSIANSIYSSAVYVGGALASLTILLDNQIGWRESSVAIGGFGLLLAGVSAVLLKDPEARPALFGSGGAQDGQPVADAVGLSAGTPGKETPSFPAPPDAQVCLCICMSTKT